MVLGVCALHRSKEGNAKDKPPKGPRPVCSPRSQALFILHTFRLALVIGLVFQFHVHVAGSVISEVRTDSRSSKSTERSTI